MKKEIFNLFELSKKELDFVLRDSKAYLQENIDENTIPSISANGFKIFYSQANALQLKPELSDSLCLPEAGDQWKTKISKVQDYISRLYDEEELLSGFEDVWTYLTEDRSIKIIHLIRNNKLKQLLSFYRATLVDQWKSYDKRAEDNSPVTLSYEQCLNFFNRYTSWEKEFDKRFCEHDKISIIYEEFKMQKDEVLYQVQDFLKVPIRTDLSTRLVKQRKRSLAEMISNYEELKNYFKNSRWEQYFED